MADSRLLPADRRGLATVLDDLAEDIARGAERFGPAAPSADPAVELQSIRELVYQARANLQEQHSASIGIDALADALTNLANLTFDSGAFSAALNLDQHVLSIRREQFDYRHPAIATALRYLARDYFHLGDYSSATRFAEE